MILSTKENKQHLGHIVRFILRKIRTQLKRTKNCIFYGEGTLNNKMCRKWFEVYTDIDSHQDITLES